MSALRLILGRAPSRLISTSGRRADTAVPAATTNRAPAKTAEPAPIITDDNWVSYGFDYKSRTDDNNYHHATFFFSVTLALVGGGFYLAYVPDMSLRDWASREAFLELRRREAAGLPAIDRNYVDPARIHLPSDEELGSTEIII